MYSINNFLQGVESSRLPHVKISLTRHFNLVRDLNGKQHQHVQAGRNHDCSTVGRGPGPHPLPHPQDHHQHVRVLPGSS